MLRITCLRCGGEMIFLYISGMNTFSCCCPVCDEMPEDAAECMDVVAVVNAGQDIQKIGAPSMETDICNCPACEQIRHVLHEPRITIEEGATKKHHSLYRRNIRRFL